MTSWRNIEVTTKGMLHCKHQQTVRFTPPQQKHTPASTITCLRLRQAGTQISHYTPSNASSLPTNIIGTCSRKEVLPPHPVQISLPACFTNKKNDAESKPHSYSLQRENELLSQIGLPKIKLS
ncbi:hypothetical protein TNCV_2980801 [Trichonephila clavipes]|nr:hypothetical protein TNCV_2980801 [Trichonephila clavipes]